MANDMTALQVLRRARALISAPGRWTKFSSGRDAEGRSVGPISERAVCFCAIGAIYHTNFDDPGDEAVSALRESIGMPIADFNDAPNRTHAEVLAAFDKAIASLEAA